ncbi:MAG: HTH domain-containing protein [Bacteroidales bacterium]|nr:HTH domain-containing protein [Bacteroidales bacterium]
MSGLKYINRLSQIDRLIKQKSTGTPKELSMKLDICERQVYNYITELKKLGANIWFNPNSNSYEYKNDNTLSFFNLV